MELGFAIIGMVSIGLNPGWTGIFGAIFGWLLATLAVLDYDHFWLPDALVIPTLFTGLVVGKWGPASLLPDRLVGMMVGFVALRAIGWGYRRVRKREGLGDADAKMLAAVGAWLGWEFLPFVLLAASLLGIGWWLSGRLRGVPLQWLQKLPLGTLMAIAAWPMWFAAELQGQMGLPGY